MTAIISAESPISEKPEIDFRVFAERVGTVVHYGAGDIIFRENDPSNVMYVVLRGSVEITSRDKVIDTIGAGKALGVIALLDNLPRTATARATVASELALIDRKTFRYMVDEIPNFGWYVMGELAHRLRTTNAAL